MKLPKRIAASLFAAVLGAVWPFGPFSRAADGLAAHTHEVSGLAISAETGVCQNALICIVNGPTTLNKPGESAAPRPEVPEPKQVIVPAKKAGPRSPAHPNRRRHVHSGGGGKQYTCGHPYGDDAWTGAVSPLPSRALSWAAATGSTFSCWSAAYLDLAPKRRT